LRFLGTTLLLGAAACARAETTTPAAPAPEVVDVGRAARDVGELQRAVGRRVPGAHRIAGASHVVVSAEGKPLESLDEQTLVERDARGVLHAVYTNSRDQGRELFAAGDTVWVRPRYGKFHRRPPAEPGEAERVASEVGGVFAAHLELVAAGIALRDAGAATAAGRPARRIVLGRGGGARPRAAQAGPRAWRDSVSVEALEGEVLLDDATGALLLGRLAARASFVRDGRQLEMTLSSTHELQAVGDVTVLPPPDEHSSPTPTRSSEFEDREWLLSGLAAPARRAPAPAPRGADGRTP
jgi:hypothetical protein